MCVVVIVDCKFRVTSSTQCLMGDLFNKKHRDFIFAAIQEANKSCMHSQHGCVIICNGNIVSKGHNYRKYTPPKYSVHAEEHAIQNLSNKDKKFNRCKTGLSMYVVRIRENGQITNSKPCMSCTRQISKIEKISKIFYSSA